MVTYTVNESIIIGVNHCHDYLENVYQQFCCYFIGRESDNRRVLKPDGQAILLMALTSLQDAIRSLKDGSIECQLLTLISDHVEQFLMLCQQISADGKEHLSLRQCLDQRRFELNAFEEERDQVFTFLRLCSLIKQGNVCVARLQVYYWLFFCNFNICDIITPKIFVVSCHAVQCNTL